MKVEDGDINKANRILSSILARDGVMKEWFENRRHQQKGELRRKLVSMRWRRLFKHEVSARTKLLVNFFYSYVYRLGKRLSLSSKFGDAELRLLARRPAVLHHWRLRALLFFINDSLAISL